MEIRIFEPENEIAVDVARQWGQIAQKDENGQWDLGAAAKDGVYFPLSDSWRKRDYRIADCTERITNLLQQIVK